MSASDKPKLLGAQCGEDLLGPALKVALSTCPAQHRHDSWLGQRLAQRGGRRDREHRDRVSSGQILAERRQRGGVELPQHRPQLVGLPLPGPDHRLMGPCQRLDDLGALAVAGDRPMVVTVGADDLGEHVRVAGVALGARGGVPLADSGRPAAG